MSSNDREGVVAVLDGLKEGLDRALELSFDTLTTPELLAVLARLEILRRRLPAVEHPVLNQLRAQASRVELGGKLSGALADRLKITRGEAQRRIDDAAELGPRRTLTGEPLQPVRPATAAAQRDGLLGAAHVRIIRDFFHYLPNRVDFETRESAEAQLADLATRHRPDELAKLAKTLFDRLNQDGLFSDAERAKRRTLILGPQDRDGMSPITGCLSPEARATLDAVLARWAAPGMCNPADDTPCLSGTPSQAAIDGDTRSAGQRNHDALTALGRAMLASGDLGQHNGLPASIIVSVSLAELEAAAGIGVTGGGTWLPMRDVIRLASRSHQYLRIFDNAKELKLYHAKRLATPGQRLVLYARDRGCTHPGCTVPGYLSEAHHVTDYAKCRCTDVNDLTLRCGCHHQLITDGGWQTRKRADGVIETLPPAHLDHGQPRTNSYHHPERLLLRETGDDDPPAAVSGL